MAELEIEEDDVVGSVEDVEDAEYMDAAVIVDEFADDSVCEGFSNKLTLVWLLVPVV